MIEICSNQNFEINELSIKATNVNDQYLVNCSNIKFNNNQNKKIFIVTSWFCNIFKMLLILIAFPL